MSLFLAFDTTAGKQLINLDHLVYLEPVKGPSGDETRLHLSNSKVFITEMPYAQVYEGLQKFLRAASTSVEFRS